MLEVGSGVGSLFLAWISIMQQCSVRKTMKSRENMPRTRPACEKAYEVYIMLTPMKDFSMLATSRIRVEKG